MAKIKIQTVKNLPIDSNCFIVFNNLTNNVLIIDPGSQDCSSLVSTLTNSMANVEYIILTHEHFDHIWGVNILKDLYNCKIICSTECAEKIIDRKKNLSVFFDQIGFETYGADIQFDVNRYSFDWNGILVELVKTKGHSEGSICIIIEDVIFTGDTIIKDAKTVLKLPDSNRNKLKLSLDLINSICNNNTVIYPGHGDCFVFENFNIYSCC